MSIGMFDSGLGGLTVMRQLVKQLPNESIVYFGDTARVPYGDKSSETIINYSLENSHFLLQNNVKLLVVACNTASAHALESIKSITSVPVIGVIKPGVKKAVETTKNGHIAVLATRGTIRSGVYQKEIQNSLPDAKVQAIACPLFVPLVEDNFIDHPATKLIVKEYLQRIKQEDIDTILLGCTHYPVLSSLIQKEMGDKVQIVDSATCCAEEVAIQLEKLNLLTDAEPSYRFFVSDDPEKFQSLGPLFFGKELHEVSLSNKISLVSSSK